MPTYTYSPLAGAGWQLFNNSGVPLAGGLLYTYAAGTTTPATTYTSSSGSTPNSNPIVLDSAGRTPAQIWLDSGSNYKFILRDSTGVLIWTNDNIPGSTAASAVSYSPTGNFTATTVQGALDELATSSGANIIKYNQGATGAVTRTVKSKLQDVVSVKDFGATGDGTTDDTAAIQAAVNALSQAGVGGVVRFPAGTYKVTSNINITWPNGSNANAPAHVTLEGDGADITYIYDYRPGTPTNGCITVDFSAVFGSRFFTCEMGGFSLIKKVNATTLDIPTNTYTIGTGTGLYMNSVPGLGSFYNIRLVGYNASVQLVDCLGITFDNLMISTCDLGVVAGIVVNTEPTVLNFNNCSASACKSIGFLISGGGPVSFNQGLISDVGDMAGGSQGVSGGIFYGTSAFITTELTVNGVYFERNRGNADIYINTPVSTATRSVSNINNCFFARNNATLYTTNNIMVANASATATLTVNTIGNGFKGYSPYVASASRRYIATSGTYAGAVTIYGLGNFYNDPTETPTVVTNIVGGGGGSQDLQSVTAIGATTTINSNFNGANIGTFSGVPAVTSTGSTVGFANSTNAAVLASAVWRGSGDFTNDLGASGFRWNNLYLKNVFAWNGYNIPAPTGSTTTFLRNDGTWQTPAGSGLGTVTSVATGNGLTGGPITSTGTVAIDYTYAGTWTANQSINGANIGTFSGTPAVTSAGSTVGLANSTNAVVLNGANWTGSGDGSNNLGSSGVRWDNLYLKTNLVWNSYNIPAPAGSTTTFLRNDGTWASISGGSGTVTSVTAGSGLSGGTITTSGTISLDTSSSNTWSATQTFSSAVQTNTINANGGNITLASTVAVVPSVGFAPTVDGSYFLGGASLRWNTVYAVTGTINTSDENQKQDIRALNEAELRVAVKLKGLIRAFKFKDAVTAKGDKARIHVGVIAQQVANAFESEGLSAAEYGLFCLDVLEDQTEQLGIRYDELLAFIISAL